MADIYSCLRLNDNDFYGLIGSNSQGLRYGESCMGAGNVGNFYGGYNMPTPYAGGGAPYPTQNYPGYPIENIPYGSPMGNFQPQPPVYNNYGGSGYNGGSPYPNFDSSGMPYGYPSNPNPAYTEPPRPICPYPTTDANNMGYNAPYPPAYPLPQGGAANNNYPPYHPTGQSTNNNIYPYSTDNSGAGARLNYPFPNNVPTGHTGHSTGNAHTSYPTGPTGANMAAQNVRPQVPGAQDDKSKKPSEGGLQDRAKELFSGGGPNRGFRSLIGGLITNQNMLKLMDGLAHRYTNVDEATGHVIGFKPTNSSIFNFGGKDNFLGTLGKIVLDNLVSKKYKRKVQPFVKPSDATDAGSKPSAQAATGRCQLFEQIRDDCLRTRKLFEDPDFPADNSALFNYTQFKRRQNIEWKRPGEICSNPCLFLEGHSRFDIKQGELGNCWFLAAVANLTLRDELFYRVVPPDQSFTENYAGVFHFQFWQYGKWVDVVIDDRLPTSGGKLLYLRSDNNSEFWGPLLEKAYAKFYGNYEILRGGTTCEALEDFTGGLTELIDLKQPPKNLLQLMFATFQMGSLLGCSIQGDGQIEKRLSNGLICGHAYSVTGMKIVQNRGREIPLLRIRNPWGNEAEWKGAWSDHSPEWNSISSSDKAQLGLKFDHDGEFWMCYDDFVRQYDTLEICNLGPDVMDEVEQMIGRRPVVKEEWRMQMFDSRWTIGKTAGGCRNNLYTFARNPQFLIHLTDPTPDDDDFLCTCVIAVMQKYRRQLRRETIPIGFAVYKVSSEQRTKLNTQFFERNQSTARTPAFINLREVCGRFRLPPGYYVLVPSSYDPDQEAEILVRIYKDNYGEIRELF